MQDQAHAIMRNTRTLESYRAWSRSTSRWGQPLIAAAIVPLVLGGVIVGEGLIRGSVTNVGAAAMLTLVGPVLIGLGVILTALRRKSHPWVAPE
jgi:hypothetical protein